MVIRATYIDDVTKNLYMIAALGSSGPTLISYKLDEGVVNWAI